MKIPMTVCAVALAACGGATWSAGTSGSNASSGPASAGGSSSSTSASGTSGPQNPSWAGLVDAPQGQWNLAEREYWNALNEELAGYVRDARQNCGVDFVASYDHESFRGRMTEGGSYGLSVYDRNCASSVQAIRDICVMGEMQKQAIRQSGITHIVCSHGTPAYSIQGNEGRVTFDDSTTGATMQQQWSDYVRSHI